MNGVPLTKQCHYHQVFSAVEVAGENPRILARRSGIPMWQEADLESFVPLRHVLRLLNAGSKAAGMESFGAHVADCSPFDKFANYGKLISSAGHVGNALRVACDFVRAHTTVSKLWLKRSKLGVWFCRAQLPLNDIELDLIEQYTISEMVRVVRLGAGGNWHPPKARLCSARAGLWQNVEALQSTDLRFGCPYTAIFVPDAYIAKVINPDDIPEAPGLDELTEKLADDTNRDARLWAAEALVRSLLQFERPSLEQLSSVAGIHPRKLQRILKSSGRTYREIVDEARIEISTGHLRDTRFSIAEIASKLHFSDTAHFSRSFRRLKGCSPGDYRRRSDLHPFSI